MKSLGRAQVKAPPESEALALVKDELEQVESRLHRILESDSAPVREMVTHLSQFGGKRLRPALVLLAAKAVGEVTDAHRSLGVIVELIHLATLLHDDVLDQASTRRQLATLNSRVGNRLPILLGDVVYSQAFALCNTLEDRTASRTLAETTRKLCVGEIEQNWGRGRLDLSEQEYFRIIEFKTASLYEASAFLGAHYAGASRALRHALGEYGRRLGIAFQIVDDCLDLVGDESRVGKSLGTDLEERKLTLPLLHLVARLEPREREALRRLLEEPTRRERRALLQERFDLQPDLGYAQAIAEQCVSDALRSLEVLPPTGARDALAGVARYILVRDL